MFKVIKAINKTYGYVHKWIGPGKCPSYIIGPQNTCRWYRYKRDALARAEDFNKEEIKQ